MLRLLLKSGVIKRFFYKLKKKKMVQSLQRAIAEAKDLTGQEGKKCMIYKIDGEYKVVTKKDLRGMKSRGAFKGLSYRDIESRALVITR